MDPQRILKALSNPHRLDIILWLKHPEQELGVQVHSKTLIDFPNSVSVKRYNKEVSIQADNIDKLLETVTLDDTSYPSTEDSSMLNQQQSIGISTKGLDYEKDNT